MSEYKPFYKICSADCVESATGVYIKKPKIIGLVENDGVQIKNIENMKYFRLPKREMYPLDLNMGLDSYVHRTPDYFDSNLRKMAHYIMNKIEEPDEIHMNHKDKEASTATDDAEVASDTGSSLASSTSLTTVSCSGELSDNEVYEVITHHGVLTVLMKTPSNNFAGEWNILATQYNNKLYLARKKDKDENCNTPRSTHHFKFAQYCFSTDPNNEPDITAPINENKQIYAIFNTILDKLSITYSAEIDGIASSEKLANINDIDEVQQCPLVYTKLMRDNIRNWRKNYRIKDFWIKCYISAVADLYLGFKTYDGYVKQPVFHIKVNQLPKDQAWSPKVCNTFVHTFITKVIEEMRGVNDLYSCYEFYFDPRTLNITYRIHEGLTKYSFLPNDFVEYLRKTS